MAVDEVLSSDVEGMDDAGNKSDLESENDFSNRKK